jgi:hypothetical protein
MYRLLLTAIVLTACERPRPHELGVEVFSTDTVPAQFMVSVTGNLEIGLRSESFSMRPDKSLVLMTPASLVIQKGEGTATLTSFTDAQRIAVKPIGTPPDSADILSVVGTVVKLVRVGEEQRVKLSLEKP